MHFIVGRSLPPGNLHSKIYNRKDNKKWVQKEEGTVNECDQRQFCRPKVSLIQRMDMTEEGTTYAPYSTLHNSTLVPAAIGANRIGP